MTLREAVALRVPRVRHARWGDPFTYYRLPLLPGLVIGDWVELYDDRQQLARGIRPGTARLLLSVSGFNAGFVPYWGPVSPFEHDPMNFARTYLDF